MNSQVLINTVETPNTPELSLFLPVLDEEENLRPMHLKIQEALDSLGKTAARLREPPQRRGTGDPRR